MIAVLAFLLAQAPSAPTAAAPSESDYYSVDYLRAPEGALVEVGGIAFLPDGKLAVSTRRGQVWLVESALDPDPLAAKWSLYCEGLQEGLGLAVVNEHLVVLQRGELSLLDDADRDGRCDSITCVSNGWGLTGNYHEFAYGLPIDDALNAYVALNVGFWDPKWWHGKSKAPWRGWVVKVTPDGRVVPFASGFRSPCGISMSPENELWVTDNQGDWMPAGPVFHVKKGAFHGHPASLAWTDAYRATSTEPSDTVPPDVPRAAPALWLPYKWSRSAGNVVWDTTGGKFGPFDGDMLVSELTNGMLLRASLERVRGEWQGAVFPFRRKIGSVVRVAFAPDGTLVCGMTNRGWGGLSPASGIARVRWTGKTPFEVERVRLLADGFELAFTEPLARDFTPSASSFAASAYHYDWWWQYGSPERGTKALAVASVAVSADRKKVELRLDDFAPGEMVRVVLQGFRSASGLPLLHDELAYTLNQLPEGSGPLCTTPIARLVPPPVARETKDEGWLRLTYRDAFEQWESKGWRLRDVDLDLGDPTKLATWEGVGALVNDAPGETGDTGETGASDYVCKRDFGDGVYAARFFLPEGSEAELWIAGAYAVRCAPPERADGVRRNRCGSIVAGDALAPPEPALDAWKGAGQWHALEVLFRAARFDAAGAKIASARIERVAVDDVEVLSDVELPGPSKGALRAEAPRGPLVVRAKGRVAMGGLRVKPLDSGRVEGEAWTPLYDGEDLEGWTATGTASWTVDEDGVLTGSGGRGVLWTARDDLADFELSARARIAEGGFAALWLRASEVDGAPAGHAAAINASYPEPAYTGSFLGVAPVATQLVGADTWFDYRVACTTVPEGARLRAWINGVLFTDVVDRAPKPARGRVGVELRTEGASVELRSIAVRALD